MSKKDVFIYRVIYLLHVTLMACHKTQNYSNRTCHSNELQNKIKSHLLVHIVILTSKNYYFHNS